MKMNTLNFWVDLISLIVLFTLIYTGLIIYYVLPPCDSCTASGFSTETASLCASSTGSGCPLQAQPPCANSEGCSGCSVTEESSAKAEPMLWGFGRHDFGKIHFILALVMIALMTLHIILHWSWVCTTTGNMLNMTVKKPGFRNTYGIIFLMLLIVFTCGSLYWLKMLAR